MVLKALRWMTKATFLSATTTTIECRYLTNRESLWCNWGRMEITLDTSRIHVGLHSVMQGTYLWLILGIVVCKYFEILKLCISRGDYVPKLCALFGTSSKCSMKVAFDVFIKLDTNLVHRAFYLVDEDGPGLGRSVLQRDWSIVQPN